VVESFTRPLQITNTPRGSCPSTNKIASFGYVADEDIASSAANAGLGKSQKIRSLTSGHAMQLSTISSPYGPLDTPPFLVLRFFSLGITLMPVAMSQPPRRASLLHFARPTQNSAVCTLRM